MIQPSLVPCEIRKEAKNPAELRTDPCMSVYTALRHLIYIVGMPKRAIFMKRISRLTRGNAFRMSMKHSSKWPNSRVSRCAAVSRANNAWAQLPPSMKPPCCWGIWSDTKGRILLRIHRVNHLWKKLRRCTALKLFRSILLAPFFRIRANTAILQSEGATENRRRAVKNIATAGQIIARIGKIMLFDIPSRPNALFLSWLNPSITSLVENACKSEESSLSF